ncbi:MAG: cyclic nucleotide-binding domain-containing protein [Pseudomonadota bacterium]
MDWVEAAGYLASGLVFCTFCMKTMMPLRLVAIASNVAFIVFGFFGGVYPVLVLHSVLLPLNTYRLLEMRALVRKIRNASATDLSVDAMLPLMAKRRLTAGTVLFKKGAPAQEMYYMLRGSVGLKELGRSLGPGALIGEIGVFSPEHERTATAICETDVELLTITKDKISGLWFQNPELSYHLTRLIISRLLDNQRRAMADLGLAASGSPLD